MSDMGNVADTADSVAQTWLDGTCNHPTMFFCEGMVTVCVRIASLYPILTLTLIFPGRKYAFPNSTVLLDPAFNLLHGAIVRRKDSYE
jgi:hypothetical protein